MNIWDIIIPIVATAVVNGLILGLTYILNSKKRKSELKKEGKEAERIDAEIEEIQTKTWARLLEQTQASLEAQDAKNKEIEARMVALEKSREQLEIELKQEKDARIELEKKIERIRLWLVRNAKKLEEAHIEPLPLDL